MIADSVTWKQLTVSHVNFLCKSMSDKAKPNQRGGQLTSNGKVIKVEFTARGDLRLNEQYVLLISVMDGAGSN